MRKNKKTLHFREQGEENALCGLAPPFHELRPEGKGLRVYDDARICQKCGSVFIKGWIIPLFYGEAPRRTGGAA